MVKVRFILAVILCALFSNSRAQQYEFGTMGVATGYMGDINPTNPFYFNDVGGGMFMKYNLNSTWGLRAGLNRLALYGNDADFDNEFQQNRKLNFSNRVTELSLLAEFNFFRYIASKPINRYTPYLIAGIAVIHHSPFVYYDGEKQYLRDLKLEYEPLDNRGSYSNWAIAIPVGLGFKYNIKGPWTIGAEVSYRTVLSDHIDNVSKNYANIDFTPTDDAPIPWDEFKNNNFPGRDIDQDTWQRLADPSGRLDINSGTARGDGKKYDGYMTAGLTLTYTLISKKCYWWQ